MAERAKRAVKKVQLPVTRLGAAMKTAPKLSDSNAARAQVDEWLAEIASTQTGKAIKRRLAPAQAGKIVDVIAAIAEASPYLWNLIRAEPDRFLAFFDEVAFCFPRFERKAIFHWVVVFRFLRSPTGCYLLPHCLGCFG